jgi:hypothetical protein
METCLKTVEHMKRIGGLAAVATLFARCARTVIGQGSKLFLTLIGARSVPFFVFEKRIICL